MKSKKDLPILITDAVGSNKSLVIHTILFIAIFALYFFHFAISDILLILTTAVSLEAIYLSILIQLTVNRNTQSLADVEENLDEIQEDVEEIEKDIDEIQEDVEGIEKDVDEIQEDVEEIEKDVDEIEKDIDADDLKKREIMLHSIEQTLQQLIKDIESMKEKNK